MRQLVTLDGYEGRGKAHEVIEDQLGVFERPDLSRSASSVHDGVRVSDQQVHRDRVVPP